MLRKTLLIAIALASLSSAHEAYYVEFQRGPSRYAADRGRLDQCQWHQNRTPRISSLYFSDPKTRTQILLTYPRQVQHQAQGRLRLTQAGQAPLTESVNVYLNEEDTTHLSLKFQGASIQGEIWLDLVWWDHGR